MPAEKVRQAVSTLSPRSLVQVTSNLRGDTFGGIVAGATMLPQAMAYGIVSGLGPVAGLYGTMAVCLFAGVFGGTRGMIGGPNMFVAVAMAAVVAEYAANLAEAFTAAMLAGLIQLAFGALKLGRYVAYIPYSLMSGFFTAAGLLIVVTQVVPALGGEAAGGGIVGNIRAWPAAFSNVNLHAVAVAAVSLGVAVFWPRRLARWVPAQFLALVLAALAGMLIFRDAPVIGSIPFEFPGLQTPCIDTGGPGAVAGTRFHHSSAQFR